MAVLQVQYQKLYKNLFFYGLIDTQMVQKIKRKASDNRNKKLLEKKIRHNPHKLDKRYDELISYTNIRNVVLNDLKSLDKSLDELDFKIDTYDSTLSDADDFFFTKEALQEKKENLEKRKKNYNTN